MLKPFHPKEKNYDKKTNCDYFITKKGKRK